MNIVCGWIINQQPPSFTEHIKGVASKHTMARNNGDDIIDLFYDLVGMLDKNDFFIGPDVQVSNFHELIKDINSFTKMHTINDILLPLYYGMLYSNSQNVQNVMHLHVLFDYPNPDYRDTQLRTKEHIKAIHMLYKYKIWKMYENCCGTWKHYFALYYILLMNIMR